MQRIYAHISIQVTVDHAEHQGEVGAWGVTKSFQCFGKSCCNEVDMYGKKEAGTGEHLNTFNQINKHKWKAAAPHGRLPHTKHKLKCQAWSSLVFQCRHSSFYSFRSSSVGLETGEWRRCRSLSFTPPASLRSHGSRPRPTRHIPPSPLAGRGVLPRLRSTPPLPPLPGGARQGGRGVPGGKDRRGERKETEGWGVTEKREGREEKKKSRSGSRTHCRSVLNQLSGSLAVPCDGTGPLWWTARCPFRLLAAGDGSSSRGQPAASPPFPAPPPTWRMAAGSGPLANGGDSSAPSRMAATPPRPRSTAASLPSHLFFFCSSTTTSGSHWRSPPLPAARSSQHRDPTQQRGLSDSVSLLPPGLRHQCNEDDMYGKKEAGTGEHLNTFNQINKHKWKAASPHGRLPHTKHKLKCQAWSSLVFQCRHSSFYSFRSSSVGLETGEWRRCRSLSFTPPASLRSHGSRPRPTRHSCILAEFCLYWYIVGGGSYVWGL